jgi:hypothetical protein
LSPITRDFELDLLFFNRALNCLVAFELKVVEFEPEHLGKLQFYLEALDRDVKKGHEQPSIGVLLCATRSRARANRPSWERSAGDDRRQAPNKGSMKMNTMDPARQTLTVCAMMNTTGKKSWQPN